MGNNQGKNKGEERIDFGKLEPYGIYNNKDILDYDVKLLKKWILARKMAPFYKGLNDLSELKDLNNNNGKNGSETSSNKNLSIKLSSSNKKERENSKDNLEAFYNQSLECPICFLIYPININYSNCCDQPICTECLIQIKSKVGSTTPPDCPFCAKEDFSFLYCAYENPALVHNNSQNSNKLITSHKKAIPLRIEELRPEPIRNINLDLRQPMLIHPGRFLSLRPGRRQRSGDSAYSDYFLTMQSMGVDLEELMVMEAIRASLLEQEQAQAQSQQEQSEARENNNENNNNNNNNDNNNYNDNEGVNETNSIVESPTVIEAEEQRSNNSTIRDLSHDITNSSDKSSYPNEISDSGSTPKVQY